MRFTMLAGAAALLLLLPVLPVFAGAAAGVHPMQSTDFSAARKKVRTKATKRKAEKVEYMRAVPWR